MNQNTRKKALVVEVNSRGKANYTRLQILKDNGYDVYYLTTTKDIDPYDFKQVRRPASTALDEICKEATDWHRIEKFDIAMTTDETSIIAMGRITEELNLPGLGQEAARNSRNKWYMRRSHEAGSAPHPKFARCDTLDQALAAASDIGYPVILKPTLGAYAQYVHKIPDPATMEKLFMPAMEGSAIHSYRKLEAETENLGPCTMLVEEFLAGSEHMVEAVIHGQELHIGAIADRLSLEIDTFDDDLYKMPTSLTDEQIALVHETVRLGAISQGIALSTLHAEVRFHNGKPYIVEIAARPGGGSIQYTSKASYDYCPMTSAIRVAEGVCPEFVGLQKTGYVSTASTMLCDAGYVEQLDVPEGIRERPEVLNFQIVQKVGNTVIRPPDGNDVLGFLGVKAKSLDEVLALSDSIASSISIKTSNKKQEETTE